LKGAASKWEWIETLVTERLRFARHIRTFAIRHSTLLAVLIGSIGPASLITAAPIAAQPASPQQAVKGPPSPDDTATLSGAVLDESGAAVPGASVIAVNLATGQQRETQSSEHGTFTFSTLAPGRYSLTAQLSGFEPTAPREVVLASGREISVGLEMRIAPLNEAVSVRGTAAPVAAGPSTIDVSPVEVRNVAGAADNIFRVLQTLPGVSAVNDFDSRLTVRGGGPDQNLTMMDGVEIHNPFRLFGLTSAFNPATVDRFELTAGGFNAKYGDRLSSILVVENRDGVTDKPVAGRGALSLTDGNVVVEGRTPGFENSSWLVTGRRTYYDLIAGSLTDTKLPSFADVQARAVWEFRPGQRLIVSGLSSQEGTDAAFNGSTPGERLKLLSSTHNDLAAVAFISPIDTRVLTKTTVSWYRDREQDDFNGDLQSGALRSNRPEADATPPSDAAIARSVAVRDVAIREELTFKASGAHVVETGFENHALETGWDWRIAGNRIANGPNGTTVRGGASLPPVLDSTRDSQRGGAWVTDRWILTPRLRAEPGVRIDWSGLADEIIASPRMALIADIDASTKLRLAGGLFTQSPGYEKLLQSDYFFDLSDAAVLRLRSERAWHAVIGIERAISHGLSAHAEGYYKRFDRLIVGRLETPAEVANRLRAYNFPSEFSDSVPRAPQITTTPGNDATGQAYGVEISLVRQAQSPSTRLTGWASYALGKAETTAYGRTFASDYDRRHALSLAGVYHATRLLELATTVRVQSGLPYSPPVGVRVAAVQDPNASSTDLVPRRDLRGLPVWTVAYGDSTNLNSARLPLFARVDFRATFRPKWMNNRWQLYVDVINLLNRRNAASLDTQLAYDPTAARPRITTAPAGSFPVLPSFGVRVTF
jgi:hypothetical protein